MTGGGRQNFQLKFLICNSFKLSLLSVKIGSVGKTAFKVIVSNKGSVCKRFFILGKVFKSVFSLGLIRFSLPVEKHVGNGNYRSFYLLLRHMILRRQEMHNSVYFLTNFPLP